MCHCPRTAAISTRWRSWITRHRRFGTWTGSRGPSAPARANRSGRSIRWRETTASSSRRSPMADITSAASPTRISVQSSCRRLSWGPSPDCPAALREGLLPIPPPARLWPHRQGAPISTLAIDQEGPTRHLQRHPPQRANLPRTIRHRLCVTFVGKIQRIYRQRIYPRRILPRKRRANPVHFIRRPNHVDQPQIPNMDLPPDLAPVLPRAAKFRGLGRLEACPLRNTDRRNPRITKGVDQIARSDIPHEVVKGIAVTVRPTALSIWWGVRRASSP